VATILVYACGEWLSESCHVAWSWFLVTAGVHCFFAGFVARRTTGFFKAQSAAHGRLSGFVNEMVGGRAS
jgi:hypothetical protein